MPRSTLAVGKAVRSAVSFAEELAHRGIAVRRRTVRAVPRLDPVLVSGVVVGRRLGFDAGLAGRLVDAGAARTPIV